jgi:septum formation protein
MELETRPANRLVCLQVMEDRRTQAVLLGSASPRRAKILASLGVRFEILVPRVNEADGGDPCDTVRRNALSKLDWCRSRQPVRRILTADTVVVWDGKPVGKPASLAEARRWLLSFSGQDQEVLTGIAYLDGRGRVRNDVVRSVVRFRALGDGVVDAYLAQVNPLDKAGGYDIDQHGELLIAGWEGSHTNIMGLPVERLTEWLREDGVL